MPTPFWRPLSKSSSKPHLGESYVTIPVWITREHLEPLSLEPPLAGFMEPSRRRCFSSLTETANLEEPSLRIAGYWALKIGGGIHTTPITQQWPSLSRLWGPKGCEEPMWSHPAGQWRILGWSTISLVRYSGRYNVRENHPLTSEGRRKQSAQADSACCLSGMPRGILIHPKDVLFVESLQQRH